MTHHVICVSDGGNKSKRALRQSKTEQSKLGLVFKRSLTPSRKSIFAVISCKHWALGGSFGARTPPIAGIEDLNMVGS